MRKIVVLSFLTLDGVMQAPGRPDEDNSGDFKHGGWITPYFDEEAGELMAKQMEPADLLLGRKTFEIFEPYWPYRPHEWPEINFVNKYVVSETRSAAIWLNSKFLPNIDAVKGLKNSEGGDLRVHGSSELVQALLENDMVDELWLKFFPITIGKGKKLFGNGTIPAAFELIDTVTTSKGVIFANYKRAGEIKTGDVSTPQA